MWERYQGQESRCRGRNRWESIDSNLDRKGHEAEQRTLISLIVTLMTVSSFLSLSENTVDRI